MSSVRAVFSDLDAGWVTVSVQSGNEAVVVIASYVHDSFYSLVQALHTLRLTPGQAVVLWDCEPEQCEMGFNRSGESVGLRLTFYPDGRRNASETGETRLSVFGNYDEVCLPFWRALRSLQGRYTAAELEARWQSDFPWREIETLTALLGKGPPQADA